MSPNSARTWRVRFDPTVSLSALLSLLVGIVTVVLAYATLDKRLAILETIVERHDAMIHAHSEGDHDAKAVR